MTLRFGNWGEEQMDFRCGRLGLAGLTAGLFAVRSQPPNGLSRIFEGIGIALWRYVYPLDSMLGSPVSSGAAIGAIRSPPNVSGSILRSPRRHHPRRCLPLGRSRAYRESVTTVMQRSLASEKTVEGRAVGASLFPITR